MPSNKKYKVTYAYIPTEGSQDIELSPGDILTGIKELDNGWSIGFNVTQGTTGTFPSQYVSLLEDSGDVFKPKFLKNNLLDQKSASLDQGLDRKKNVNYQKYSTVTSNYMSDGKYTPKRVQSEPTIDITTKDNIKKLAGSKNAVSMDSVSSKKKTLLHQTTVKLSGSIEVLNETGGKLFKSERGEYKKVKSVAGAITGVLLGGLLFLGAYYGIGYSLPVAGGISAAASIIMAVGFAVSVHCRCIAALMVPSLFTNRGRAAILSIVISLLLSGPIMNIFTNYNEASASMSCSAELALNQSRTIQDLAKGSFNQVIKELEGTVDRLQAISNEIKEAFSPIQNGLGTVQNGLGDTKNTLWGAVQKCKQSLNNAHRKCKEGLNSAYRQCKDAIKIPGFDKTCEVLKVGDAVCQPLNLQNAGRVCNTANTVDEAINTAISKTQQGLEDFHKLFEIDVQFDSDIGANANSSKTANEITALVKQEFQMYTENVEFVIDIVSKALSFSVLLIFFHSYFYLKNYLGKDKYDNIYVTHKFKKLDSSRKEKGKEHLLPLKKKERRWLVDTTSVRLSQAEKSLITLGLATLLIHFIMAAVICLFDYLLYILLYVIQKHGDIQLEYSGEQSVNFAVKGDGLIALFFRTFVNGIDSNTLYNKTVDTTICLPDPVKPELSNYIVMGVIYILALIMIILQAYGLRARHKIVAYYYPEREHARILYLYNKVMQKRISFIKTIAKKIKFENQDDKTRKNISISAAVTAKFPCIRRVLKLCGKDERYCVNCAEAGKYHMCKTPNCNAVYCKECYSDIQGVCPLCDNKVQITNEADETDFGTKLGICPV